MFAVDAGAEIHRLVRAGRLSNPPARIRAWTELVPACIPAADALRRLGLDEHVEVLRVLAAPHFGRRSMCANRCLAACLHMVVKPQEES